MISCNWSSLILTSIFLVIIIILSLWATKKSRVKNCCKSKTDFSNCKSNFGSNFDMSSETNYNKICSNS